jgi:hypothetical protein
MVRPGAQTAREAAGRQIRSLAAYFRAPVITLSPVAAVSADLYLGTTRPIGPVLTLRRLAIDDASWTDLQMLPNGGYQIGDLELF